MFSAIENSSTSPRRCRSSGMCPSPASSAVCAIRVRELAAAHGHGAALDLLQARERVDQLRLPVAVDARDADDLARPHVEGDASHLGKPALVDHLEVAHGERTSPGCAGVFSTRNSTSRPTIARASDSSVAPARGTVSIFLPRRSTVIRSAISSTSFSLWLMKMIEIPSRAGSAGSRTDPRLPEASARRSARRG